MATFAKGKPAVRGTARTVDRVSKRPKKMGLEEQKSSTLEMQRPPKSPFEQFLEESEVN
jgi:hypothetical protein